jgi:hypothetical protein
VGDICFVIIGQIVNRPYEALHYDTFGGARLNSPSQDKELAKEVRSLWSANSSQNLLDSLQVDFATALIRYPAPFYTSVWMDPMDLQWGAATRLLYYFPKDSSYIVLAHLLDALQQEGREENQGAGQPSRIKPGKSGFRHLGTIDLSRAVAWCPDPTIHREMQLIFLGTTQPEMLAAALPSFDAEIASRFEQHLDDIFARAPAGGEVEDTDYNLLLAVGKHFGNAARPVFENYLAKPTPLRRHNVCRVLDEIHRDWSVDLLNPMLNDVHPADTWTYPITPGQPFPSLPIRICDEAADVIAKNFPKLKFTMAGDYTNLDRQIVTMRDQIARKEY